MSTPTAWSERLGAIGDAQFQQVADRFDLGRFLHAARTTSGLFGQNVFVTTTLGEWVLRGAPHWVKGPGEASWRREDRWQFTKERWFAEQLHTHTDVPVPWPMLHDETSDLLGWPYLVMPRMPGLCTDERALLKSHRAEDRYAIASALGDMLGRMQQLTWPFAGDFGFDTIQLEPHPDGPLGWAAAETRAHVASCADRLEREDHTWIERVIADALEAPDDDVPITYVHCDYKLGNLTLSSDPSWHVSGLFDFHEARFADGNLDIVRTACSYLDTEPALASVFVRAYGRPVDAARIRLHVVNDRIKFWEYFTRPEVATPEPLRGRRFRDWAGHYLDGVVGLL